MITNTSGESQPGSSIKDFLTVLGKQLKEFLQTLTCKTRHTFGFGEKVTALGLQMGPKVDRSTLTSLIKSELRMTLV